MSSKDRIELNGITAFRNFISESGILLPEIGEKNTIPVWDGGILVYSVPNHNGKNDYLRGKIPIQVKSAEASSKINHDSFDLECSAVQQYFNDGGIIFIRPVINSTTDYCIYFKLLLPRDLKELLDKKKKKQKTIRVRLDKAESLEMFERICLHFLENKPLQSHIISEKSFPKITEKEIQLVSRTINEKDIIKSLLSSYNYIYLVDKAGHNFITDFRIKECVKIVNLSVSINGREYFQNVKTKYVESGKPIFQFNSALELDFDETNIHFKLERKKDVLFNDFAEAVLFIKEFTTTQSFSLGNEIFTGDIRNTSRADLKFSEYIVKVKELFRIFKVNTEKVYFEDIEKDEKIVNLLISLFVDKIPARIENENDDVKLRPYNLINRKVLVLFKKNNSGSYDSYNYCTESFQDAFALEIPGRKNPVQCSRFVAMAAFGENFCSYIEIIDGYFDTVHNDLIINYSDELYSFYSKLVLDFIHGYDMFQKIEYLKLAERINELIFSDAQKNENFVYIINKIQITTRVHGLRNNDIAQLQKLKKVHDEKGLLMCCIYILLESYREFHAGFESLSQKEREEFKKWPIWNLYQKWENRKIG